MFVTCPACRTKFRLPEGVLSAEGRKLRCGVCDHFWTEHVPTAMMEASDRPAPPRAASPGNHHHHPLPPPPTVKPEAPRRHGWLWVLGVLAAIIGLAFFLRQTIVAEWPGLKSYYEWLGIDLRVPGEGLSLSDVKFDFRQQGADRVLMLDGNIANRTGMEQQIPLLRGMLRNDRGDIVRDWLFQLDKPVLAPNEVLSFNTILINPPKGTTTVQLDFGPFPDGRQDTP